LAGVAFPGVTVEFAAGLAGEMAPVRGVADNFFAKRIESDGRHSGPVAVGL
jgi:hypothetical protein